MKFECHRVEKSLFQREEETYPRTNSQLERDWGPELAYYQPCVFLAVKLMQPAGFYNMYALAALRCLP